MENAESSEESIYKVPIIYDGIDADKHQMELGYLADSLAGCAKIISVCANFAATGKYVYQSQAQQVKVKVEVPRKGSYGIDALIVYAQQTQLFSAFNGAFFQYIIEYVFAKRSRDKEKMSDLIPVINKLIDELSEKDHTEELLDTINNMADKLGPQTQKAVAPIGYTCQTLQIGSSDKTPYLIDSAKKEEILTDPPDEIADIKDYTITITELDLENHTAKIRLMGDEFEDFDNRVYAEISDPVMTQPDNFYVRAFSKSKKIDVTAKAAIQDGVIKRLFISDYKE